MDAELKGRNQRLAHPHELHLFEGRRLHLEHDVGLEHLASVVHNSGPGLAVVVVGKLGFRSGLGFHKHLVTVGDQKRDSLRNKRHTLLLQTGFGGNANGELGVALASMQQLFLRKKCRFPSECLDGFAS